MPEIPVTDLPENLRMHYSQLQPATPGPMSEEYETYRREVGRLIAEGHEGKHILIKGKEILGLFETEREAMAEGDRHFALTGFLVHRIQTWERLYRAWGGQMLCLIGPTPSGRTARSCSLQSA